MKYLKLLCLLLVASAIFPALAKSPKDKHKYGVYITGVSASFSDSLVYFTNIQYVDSAAVDDKDLLVGRAEYSMQLKDYLESNKQLKNRTCFVYFNRKKKNLQKEIKKLKEKYQKNKSIVVLEVDSEFIFKKAELYY